jgi:uncharacterized membrane protein (UPF0127 family)
MRDRYTRNRRSLTVLYRVAVLLYCVPIAGPSVAGHRVETNRMKLLRVAMTVCLALLLSAQSYDMSDLGEAFGSDSLIISADVHACWNFDVFVASNSDQQRRGLMFVREMPEFTGMIFIYRQAGIRSMWMKNTFIPLDMLFVRGDGTVSSVASNTTPHSLESVAAIEPVNFVVELNAGMVEKLGIGTESSIVFTHLD